MNFQPYWYWFSFIYVLPILIVLRYLFTQSDTDYMNYRSSPNLNKRQYAWIICEEKVKKRMKIYFFKIFTMRIAIFRWYFVMYVEMSCHCRIKFKLSWIHMIFNQSINQNNTKWPIFLWHRLSFLKFWYLTIMTTFCLWYCIIQAKGRIQI